MSAPEGNWLRLDDSTGQDDVGSALCAMYFHSGGTDAATADEAVRELIGFDTLYAPGGLLLHDGEGAQAEPGPRSNLFAWRTWLATLYRADVELGPGPWVEYVGDVVRVWPGEGHDGPHLDVPRQALPGMLRQAQRDLTAFLGTLRTWARTYSPQQAELLVAAVDAGLEITEPLPL
ncbi:hypothetical protein FHS29_000603 [Saccharothrix tamanrassetensis]|uniref:Uncharacterized protein n=1 Tax=Saccharothrix tamanrassetensis TaxID=1051531 RepID=A0A841CAR1_9PSEU|nr:hypothetical protein [Saccharothrix tamanrassetensis]MBB5954033.1 hypothetical protein [Saccharothrix tamanrassetensis]